VGVFVGVMHGNYQLLSAGDGCAGNPAAANSPYWSIANRVSFFMDFHGPSLAIDTACSSSLAAVHLACESIRRGECRAAIAGGVSLLQHPRQLILLSQMKMLSQGPSSRPFGENADGIVVGEGVGAVLLRPLEDALRDGDRILGVIRASAMNAGGRTSAYTVPNPQAQAELIAETIGQAGVPAESITVIEAHGTGTVLGDPIEVAGLNQAFRRFTGARHFCALGSVKSNIGHLEAAAGVAGLLKVLLEMRHRTIAPSLHCDRPNPHLALEDSPFRLVSRRETWPRAEHPRRAGISSFGAGGANVHLILEEPADLAPPDVGAAVPELIPVSARTPAALRETVARLAEALTSEPELPIADIARTLQTGRESMAERAAFIASSTGELLEALRNFSPRPNAAAPGIGFSQFPPAMISTGDLEKLPLNEFAKLWVSGASIDWHSLKARNGGKTIALPTYPFERLRHWITEAPRPPTIGLHPLVDFAEPSLNCARLIKNFTGSEWYLTEHIVAGQAVLPGSFHLEAARAAAALIRPGENFTFCDIEWELPVTVRQEGARIEILLSEHGGSLRFEIRSGKRRCSHGLLRAQTVESEQTSLASVRARCLHVIEHDEIYRISRSAGVVYGPRFQLLERLACGPDEVFADLRGAPAELPAPMLLDVALQSLLGLFLHDSDRLPRLPHSIGCLSLAVDLSHVAHIHTRRAESGQVDITLFDSTGHSLGRLREVLLRPAPAVPLPIAPTSEVSEFRRLEHAAAYKLLQILQSMGALRTPGEWTTHAQVGQTLALAPTHASLLKAFLAILSRLGAVSVAEEEVVALNVALADPADDFDGFQLRAPRLAPHLKLLQELFRQYPAILRGELLATSVFFPGGSTALLEGVYRGSSTADHFHAALADAVVAEIARCSLNPGAQPIRILEIGAGTGGATAHLLERLAPLAVPLEFWFSDISLALVQHGERTFGRSYPFMRFGVLDIEKARLPEAFAPASFDVILAANCLHATRDIVETLRHNRSLLKPGGLLLLNEMTSPSDFATLTFGLLDGWWRFQDPSLRLPFSPLLSAPQWRTALAAAGLEVSLIDGLGAARIEADFPQSLIVSRTAAAVEPPALERRTAGSSGADLSATRRAVVKAVAEVFEMSVEQVENGRAVAFTDLGADSILSAELVARINRTLGLQLKTTVIFNYPSVGELAKHIHESEQPEAASLAPELHSDGAHEGNGHHPAEQSDALGSLLQDLENGKITCDAALAAFPGSLL
jgi:3-oxoacyl-(acyl-carrier-protein) synthase/SAM-dependent methyltransferase/acyl carrier protein